MNTAIFVFDNVKDGSIRSYRQGWRYINWQGALKTLGKVSWLEEEQNIEDLLATPSSKKVYYRDFLEKINKRGLQMGCLLKYVEGGLKDLKCHVATKKHWNDKIETNKLRTRRLGNTDFSFILYDVFSWTLSLLKHWQSNWNQTCVLHSYTIIGNWHAVTTWTKLWVKGATWQPSFVDEVKGVFMHFLANLFVLSCKI